MIARIYKPGPPLGAFVDCLWHYRRHTAVHKRERALPTGTVEIVVSLREDPFRVFGNDVDAQGQRFRGAIVCGAQSGYFVLDTSQEESVVGVHFKPGGAAPFLGVPASEFTDRHVGLEDLWGARARELRERLLEAGSSEALFELLEQSLLARLRRPLLPHPAVAHALRQLTAMPAMARIGQVREETGYGAKRFIEVFRNSVGLTPKLYCRIQRFQSVIERLAHGARVDWAAVALDAGFCDQSHLNREFRAFSGVTPTDYRPVSDDRPSHVAIDG
jgi:AraC-like DNA-binding protein